MLHPPDPSREVKNDLYTISLLLNTKFWYNKIIVFHETYGSPHAHIQIAQVRRQRKFLLGLFTLAGGSIYRCTDDGATNFSVYAGRTSDCPSLNQGS